MAKLDAVATVESASPATGRVVRLTVSGSDVSDLSPNKAVVSPPVLGAEEVDMSSTRGLVAKLCPLARERVVVFARPQETRRYGDDEAAVIRAPHASASPFHLPDG